MKVCLLLAPFHSIRRYLKKLRLLMLLALQTHKIIRIMMNCLMDQFLHWWIMTMATLI